ncbi:MAG: tRNA uridine(34) 5-carboxymethylaminomethyl modification radical SAM/GNAT enzyme Elp3 [Candidatus Moranbacteria bacterium]|nr:tRNA uridine(34) 5-carboxymethylaminomethyl modification radical SAM/GNAT enzyme Elp3 [Candidatus Moranbacteria bacterium]
MNQLFSTIIKESIRRKIKSPESFDELKKEICGRFKAMTPRNADIRDFYEKIVTAKKIKRDIAFEKILKSKSIRTLSGVAVVAVLTKSHPCRGKCLYCPTEKEMPKSYLSNEPAVMRAITVNFNPYKQVQKRLRALEINGHDIDKIELIVMGGTFSDLPKIYQYWFIKECYRATNDYPRSAKENPLGNLVSKLTNEQKRNEKAKHRIIGLALETRPDTLDAREIKFYLDLGATRVEIGVQSIYNDVLAKNRRGHTVEQTIKATKLLKDAGFKVSYHMMPGLLGSSPKKDLEMFREIFSNPAFQPDLIKIYPCVVTNNSALYNLWKKKKYKALTNKQCEKLITEIKKMIPPYVRVSRLIRDIPKTSIVAGPNISNLRQIIQNKGVKCRCIRCREVRGNYTAKDKVALRRIDYNASDGKEIYLEYVSPDHKKLYSMLRLRIGSLPRLSLGISERHAIIREVHTYGKLLNLKSRDKKSPQHMGLGKKLIQETERIAKKEFGCEKISVIAGIGVRDYYRKLGYRLNDTYMKKML